MATHLLPTGDDYSPRAETAISLKEWHTNHTSRSAFILFNFIAFPIFSWLVLLLVIIYINTCAPEPRMKKVKSILKGNHKPKIWACKLQLQNEFTLSLTSVLFSTCLASSAVIFGFKTENHIHHEVGEDVAIEFQRIFSLGYVLLILDTIILGIMLVCGASCKYISKCETKLFNYSKGSTEDCMQLTKKLSTTTNSLAAAARGFPTVNLLSEASSLTAAASKLQSNIIVKSGSITEKVSAAMKQLDAVTNNSLKGLNEVGSVLISAITICEQRSEAVRDLCRYEVRQEVKISLDMLGRELELLAKHLSSLRASITDLTEQSGRILISLRASANHERNEDMSSSLELEEWATKFNTATQSLCNPTDTLKNDVKKISADIKYYISSPIDKLSTTNPVESLKLADTDPLIRSVKRQTVSVATRQEQANSLALTVSCLKAATTALIENTKDRLVIVTKETAKNALVTAKMNFNAAELTIATFPLVREEIDHTSLRINLTDVRESLTAASNSTTRRDLNAPIDGTIVKHENLECACNLTTAATNLTKTATYLATSTVSAANNEPIRLLAQSLVSVATSLTTAVSYVISNDSGSILAELDGTVEAASKFTETVSDLNTEESELLYWWQFCAYSVFFPLCCLFNHLNYIIIAFMHDLYHATSIAIIYGIIVIFLYVLLDNIPHVMCCKIKKSMLALQTLKIIAVLLLLGYVTIDVLLFFMIPNRNALDDAANHFLSVYNTTAVFFTVLVLYFIIKHRSRSPIRVFTKALDNIFYKDEKATHMTIRKRDWKELSEKEKDIEVAKSLLMKIE